MKWVPIFFRVTEDEAKKIESELKRTGLQKGDYLRECIRLGTEKIENGQPI